MVLLGCVGDEVVPSLTEDQPVDLPAQDGGDNAAPPEVQPPPGNDPPPAVLRIEEVGSMLLDDFQGSLVVTEILDDRLDSPWCRVEYALSGTPREPDCGDCVAWDVTFALLSLDTWAEGPEEPAALSHCASLDLPEGGEVRAWAWSGNAVMYDAAELGLWEPWYAAEAADGELTFSWSTELGFDPPEAPQ
jgi:hypothetical protein